MSKFIISWDTASERKGGLSAVGALEIAGRELRVKDLGITNDMLAGSIADSKLNQITTANKVAGSAVQLQTIANGGIANVSGLGLVIDSDMFSFQAVSGLQLDYNADEFQFIPGTGLQINAIGTSKLPSTLVLTDGSRAFTQPQAGVDAVGASDLTTLGQVQTLVGNAIAGDFSETIINLSGQTVNKGQVGYVEGTSGAFRLARADDPSTAIVQYACVNSTPITDGASGSFQNPSVEVNDVESYVSGINKGATLWLSTTEWGLFQSAAPSVSGQTILNCGWAKNTGTGFVLFPQEAIDL